MLELSYEVPEDDESRPFPVKRVPAEKPLQGVITSDRPLGTQTHWWGGRTVPCTGAECLACTQGVPKRWHCYAGVWDDKIQLHFLLELTAAGGDTLLKYASEHGSTRGCVIRATRIPAIANGRVHLQTRPIDLSRYNIPLAPNLAAILARLWNIPLSEVLLPGHKEIIQPIEITTEQKLRNANRLRQAIGGNGFQ